MAAVANFDVLVTLAAARRTVSDTTSANSSGATIDLLDYINPGRRQLKAVLDLGAVTSTGTLAVKIQESNTSAEAGFTDISGATFTTITSAATVGSSETIHFRTNQRYVRALATLADTGNFDFGTYIVAEKRLL